MDPDQTYADLLDDLARKWVNLEIDHHVSKKASDAFWSLAKRAFPKLHQARIDQMVYKDIPDFPYQREKLYNEHVPTVSLETGFLKKETDEVIVVESEKAPSKYTSPQYTKLYEVATVKVYSIFKKLILYDLSLSLSFFAAPE